MSLNIGNHNIDQQSSANEDPIATMASPNQSNSPMQSASGSGSSGTPTVKNTNESTTQVYKN